MTKKQKTQRGAGDITHCPFTALDQRPVAQG
jgi:hypothetical protein